MNINAAMTLIVPLRDRLRAGRGSAVLLMNAVMEGACLVADADDELDRDERATLRRAMVVLSGDGMAADDVSALLADFRALRKSETVRHRCREVGRTFDECHAAKDGLGLMAIIGYISHGLDARERQVIETTGAAAGLSKTEVAEVLEDVRARLGAEV